MRKCKKKDKGNWSCDAALPAVEIACVPVQYWKQQSEKEMESLTGKQGEKQVKEIPIAEEQINLYFSLSCFTIY